MGLSCIIGFAFGLTAGIYSLKRMYLALCLVGLSLILTCGVVTTIGIGFSGLSSWVTGVIVGFPLIILAIIALIFDSVSNGDFK